MLGLASTVSSSSTPESKYSLDFDGADDYVDTGATFSTTFAGGFSISMWVKPDDGQPSSGVSLAAAVDSSADQINVSIQTNGKLNFYLKADGDDGYIDTNGVIFANGVGEWTHVACTAALVTDGNTAMKIYINGVDRTTTTSTILSSKHDDFAISETLYIGARNTNSGQDDFFNGKISDFAIWNTALDANNVAAIYNSGRPTNLNINSGNYIKAAALQAYYRMGNGSFDDKAVGVIHDQNSSGFESSSLYASDYTSGVDGWTGFGDGDVAGNIDSIDGVDNCLRYTSNSTVGDTRAFLKSDVLTIGKVYKVTFSYYIPSGSNVDALFLDTVAGADDDTRNAVTDAWTTVTEYFTALTADIKIILGDENQYLNPATTNDIAYIKDVSITNQKIGAGFGSEMVTNGHFDTNTTGWTAGSGAGSSSITQGTYGGRDGVARVIIGGNVADGNNRFEGNITWEKDCLYYCSVDVYLLSGSFKIDGVDGDIIGVGSNSSYTSTNVLGTITYDASVDDRWRTLTGYAQGGQTGGTDEIWIRSGGTVTEFYIDNLSVKKLNGNPALTSNIGVPTAFSSDTP